MKRSASLVRAAAALLLAICGCVGGAAAQGAAQVGPPVAPMLRIEAGSVGALPRAVAVDHRRGVFFTGGDDKAVRVWRIADMRLLDTWHLPAAPGPEGQINAMALTPDGRFLAVGGWTGQAWDRMTSIYVFDTALGQIVKRVGGFPDSVGALRFSADGQMLAIGLVNKAGLAVIRWEGPTMVFQDADYPGSVLGLDIAGPQLAAVGMEAGLRLYDLRSGQMLHKAVLAEGRLPTRVSFSPTGDLLAVGFHDSVKVGVYAAGGLQPVWAPSSAGITGQANLSAVAWSADGKRLFAGGDPGSNEESRVFQWDRLSSAPAVAVRVAAQRISALAPLADGALLFLAEDPGVGRIGIDGSVQHAASAGAMDLRSADKALSTSPDAMLVSVAAGAQGRGGFSFDVARLKLAAAEGRDARAARAAPNASVAVQWKPGEATASIAGRAANLEPYEFVRAVSRLPGGEPILATEYGVRLYARNGQPRWFGEVGAVAWGTQPSADGRYVVVAAGDGTLHWLGANDGKRALSLFVQAVSNEWVAWTPQGYYASSPNGDQLIGWQLNRSKLERADFYQASQFERVLYRPDLVRAALRGDSLPAARSVRGSFDVERLATIAPPRIAVLDLRPAVDPQRPGLMRARVQALRSGGKMLDWTAFVDDIPITRTGERGLQGAESDAFVREFEFVPLTAASTLRIEVGTDAAIGVKEVALPLIARAPEPAKGDLYLLAIGVGQFPKLPRQYQLMFPERDAQEVGAFFERQAGRQYRRTHIKVLSDASAGTPTRAAIVGSLAFLRQAGPNDTVILFLASHGVRDERGNYYFAAADSRPDDVCAILNETPDGAPSFCRGAGAVGDRSSFVEWKVFFDALGASAGRRLLVVDTCEAGNISGRSETGTLRKRSASSRFSLLLAAGDGEESQEYPAGRHGLFTFAWLQALAAPRADGRVTLRDSFEQARAEVSRLRDRRIGPMTPSLDGPELWKAMPLARVGG